MKHQSIISLVVAVVVTIACLGASDSPKEAPPATAPSAPEAQVGIDNFTFNPAELTVAVGTRVTWVNHDDVPHTATSETKPAVFNSGALDTDQKFSFVFDKSGTYSYFCQVHPHMTAKVIVTAKP